jgi:hypothetical protein
MRTTVELPEPLFHRAKLAALQRRLSLKGLITVALQRELDAGQPAAARMTAPPITLNTTPQAPAFTNAELAGLMDEQELAKAGR